ncbi:hypothetical protein LRZ95_01780 [Candidatus Gracilibacteria bacterium]|nr:hypothetical protein [Candidatus Gracilibacteria bacterium]
MTNLEGLDKAELELLLKDLKIYKDLIKKVGKRGKQIFDNKFNNKNEFVVEYYGDIDESFVLAKAKEIYNKIFDINVKDDDIKLVKNNEIKGGMKIYLNDNLIDLSFLKFYNILNK